MPQCISRLTVESLVDANQTVSKLQRLKPYLTFRRPPSPVHAIICSFSDASHPRDKDYGQAGGFTGILSHDADGQDAYDLVDWCCLWQCLWQHRTRHSAYGAESIGAETADDRGLGLQSIHSSQHHHSRTSSKLTRRTVGQYHDFSRRK